MSEPMMKQNPILEHTDEYLGYLQSVRNLSEASIRAYRGDLLAFADWLAKGSLDERQVDAALVRRYIAYLSRSLPGADRTGDELAARRRSGNQETDAPAEFPLRG